MQLPLNMGQRGQHVFVGKGLDIWDESVAFGRQGDSMHGHHGTLKLVMYRLGGDAHDKILPCNPMQLGKHEPAEAYGSFGAICPI